MLKNIMIGVFLIRLKNSSIKRYSTLTLLLITQILMLSACVQSTAYRPPRTNSAIIPSPKPQTATIPLAPWEVWRLKDYGNEFVKSGNRNIADGNLKEAINNYSDALKLAKSAEEAETVLLHITSTYLKLGNSKEALATITKYSTKKGVKPTQLDSRFSLLTGYAYLQSGDVNQAYAWFSQTYKASLGNGAIAQEARRVSRQLTRAQSQSSLNSLNAKWENDSFVSSLLIEEKERRLRGGSVLSQNSFNEYFNPNFYSSPSVPAIPGNLATESQDLEIPNENNDLQQISSSVNSLGDLKFGAILPLTGTYAQHAGRVANGIQLALDEYLVTTPLLKEDSSVTPAAQAYLNLVQKEKVSAVLGPLLVRNAEEISAISASIGVPAVTFAKKRGLPDTSIALFRLGATLENQLSEISRFAIQNLGVKDLLIFLPDDELGYEVSDAALSLNERDLQSSFRIIKYTNNDLQSIAGAVSQATANRPQGIIVVDLPSKLEPLLREIKQSQELIAVPIFGTAITADLQQISIYNQLLDGIFLVSLFNPNSDEPVVKSFVDRYKLTYQNLPDLLSAQSYDATKFILNAYQSSGLQSVSGREINVMSAAPPTVGVTGELKVLPTGEIARKIRFLQLKNKMLLEIPLQ